MFTTNFKQPRVSAKVQRTLRRIERDSLEGVEKRKVRDRDRGCRFPLCGCRKLGLALEVSHRAHKGMGGNPTGSRSKAPLMMQMCRERHKANEFSIDKRNIAWEPLTELGADGPVVWKVDVRLLNYYLEGGRPRPAARLVEVARETSPGVVFYTNDAQRAVFNRLATMEL